MTPTINDVVNADGSVTRTTTLTLPNGDTNVRTHTYTIIQYQALATQIQSQIDTLTAQLAPIQANVTTVQNNLAKLNKVS